MKLHSVCFQTKNIDQMVDFYSRVFGYAPEVDGGVDYRFLSHQLTIYKLSEGNAHSTENAALIYSVDDVDKIFSTLKNKGLASDPPTRADQCRIAHTSIDQN